MEHIENLAEIYIDEFIIPYFVNKINLLASPETTNFISYTAGVFHVRCTFHKSRKGFVSLKKAPTKVDAFFEAYA